MVLLNAAAAIYVGRGDETLSQALEQARRSLDTGAAGKKLDFLIECTNA